MAANDLPKVLKPIQPYLVIAKQFSGRDQVVRYFATMYALQIGLEHKANNDAKPYLLSLMDQLEVMKREYSDKSNPLSDVITNNDIANSHIEEVALKLFDVADSKDRKAIFDKAMIRSFFTASHLFTILKLFGELSDEIDQKLKYAKWKAVEIDRCLKNGITPTPGPPGDDFDDELAPPPTDGGGGAAGIGFNVPSTDIDKPIPKPRQNVHSYVEPTPSLQNVVPTVEVDPTPQPPSKLGPAEIAKAQKLCKFASSALDYDDSVGAIEYLEEALHLLKTEK